MAHFHPACRLKMSMYRSPKRKNKSDNPSLSLNGDSIRSRGATGDVQRSGSFSSNADSNGCRNSQRSIQPEDDDTSNTYPNPNQMISNNFHSPSRHSPCLSSATTVPNLPLTSEEEIAIDFAIRSLAHDARANSSKGSAASVNRHEKENLLPDFGFTNSESNSLYGSFSEMDFDESFVSLVSYPRPSILNRSINGSDLKKVVEDTLSTRRHSNLNKQRGQGDTPVRGNGHRTVDRVSRKSLFGNIGPNRRALLGGFREASARISIEAEWNEEEDVRSMYDIAPPAEVVFDDDNDEQNADHDENMDTGDDVIMPHPSILNKTRRFRSLRRLVTSNESFPGSVQKLRAEASQHLNGVLPCDAENGAVDDDDGLVGESLLLLQSHVTEK
jgi:hypothetical protein